MRGEGLRGVGHGPGRLRTVATLDGVEFLDDGANTFLDAALFAILDLGAPLVWIADASVVAAMDPRIKEFVAERVDALVFHGEADQGDVDALDAELGRVYCTASLRTAVFAARELAKAGGRVLFSPAAPAGGVFANNAQRSAEFERAVNDL